ncbi:hypothetical protein BA011_36830 (plasmid) [Rhizobium leguminosarum]|uniref:Uncharacterized protein n=1 Tax=Rhizobium leguminosarum TaxID=384 RepID=A0A1B1CPG6_RHILE|nr:hypothetical protein BA011_36830 [Rhizobium leguminosarum]
MKKPSLVAPLAHLVAEAFVRKRLPIFGDEKCHLARWNSIELHGEIRKDRNVDLYPARPARLSWPDANPSIFQVLPAQDRGVGKAESGEHKHGQRAARRRARHMRCFELLDLLQRPGVPSVARLEPLYPVAGIDLRFADFDCPSE